MISCRYQRFRSWQRYMLDRQGDRDQSRATHHLKGLGLDVIDRTRVPFCNGGRPLPEEALWHSCRLTINSLRKSTYTNVWRRNVLRVGKNNRRMLIAIAIGGPTDHRWRNWLISWSYTYRCHRCCLLLLSLVIGCIICLQVIGRRMCVRRKKI